MASQMQMRADAAAAGKTRYFTGAPCKRGHIAERQTSNGGCVECTNPKRVIVADGRPNVAMPPGPYIFPMGADVTPAMVAYVHARALARIHADMAIYNAIKPTLKLPEGVPITSVATAVYNSAKQLRDDHVQGLVAKGWTQSMIDEACRYA